MIENAIEANDSLKKKSLYKSGISKSLPISKGRQKRIITKNTKINKILFFSSFTNVKQKYPNKKRKQSNVTREKVMRRAMLEIKQTLHITSLIRLSVSCITPIPIITRENNKKKARTFGCGNVA
jgi:hypothetical protein